MRQKDKSTKDLASPQQLIDCNTNNNGCHGGWPPHGFDYIEANNITNEQNYPVEDPGSQGSCKFDKDKMPNVAPPKFKHFTVWTSGNETLMK